MLKMFHDLQISNIYFECLTRRENGGWVESLRRLWVLDSSWLVSGPWAAQQNISILQREVRSRTKNWCSILLVIVLGCWWEEQKQESFSRLNFPSHSFNFCLWPGLAIHTVFSIPLLSSWEDPRTLPSVAYLLLLIIWKFYSKTVWNGETLKCISSHAEHLYARCVVQVGNTLH